jgi:hypothetical protein
LTIKRSLGQKIAAGKADKRRAARKALFDQAEAYWNSPEGCAEAERINAKWRAKHVNETPETEQVGETCIGR